jgi:nitrous oxide reductase accessory protein NosL
MDVAKNPRWVAGFSFDDGRELLFCSPRCLFAWREQERAAGSVWVTEYYTQRRLPASELFFVVGSDVVGPMGAALVPVRGADAAEQFRLDHGGERVVRLSEIDVELLRSLKQRSQ